ncbi:thiamine-phosphate pyrophosphorylase [Luteibacter sp. UNCMF331Sha3.1]|uniref:thiamine phosphate synthase n=1 Tax=Luteibacter sp. UNCMF331Sha3.1 TaxID=1502760 RepID=UPI0008D1BE99|nr:thiamine phosphate synthase [Luteibacter sp. UNCMF331Sha3.1]SEN45136.1 thiamine-phosphate pyrophosphorylase [Luteibacter sp. UNCMF331Sha3.1]
MTTLLRSARLRGGVYAITDGPRDDLFAAVEAALAGGARLLQYRDKTGDAARRLSEATELSSICARYDVPLIIDNDVALARETGAGVHLGQHDVSVTVARERLGEEAIIGVSCYGDVERARALAAEGADYIGFGAMHPSRTKPNATVISPDVLTQAKALGLPVVAIGGITSDNGGVLIDAGADFLAVVSGVFAAPDIQSATRRLADLFDSRSGTS